MVKFTSLTEKRWSRPALIAAALAIAALLFVLAVVGWGYFSSPKGVVLGGGSPLSRVEGAPSEPAVRGVGRYVVRTDKQTTLEHAGKTWIRIGPHRVRNAVVGDLYATREDPDLRLIELRETDSAGQRRLRLERYDEDRDWVEVSSAAER